MEPISNAIARVLETRPADDDNSVATVEGGPGVYRKSPCSDCPWRKDAVGKFPAEAFRISANTGSRDASDGFHHKFGCHQSGKEKPATCAGYILNGHDALSWRLAMSKRSFDPGEVHSEVEMFDNYFDMAVANGVSRDDPALDRCRPWRSFDGNI